MLTPAEALGAILGSVRLSPAELVPLRASASRVLRQGVVAERDQPPFDRVMMDGIAIEHARLAGGARRFPLQAMQAAGDPALDLEPGKAIEIMTGAALPRGADCIVPVERTGNADGMACIEGDYVAERGQFIHRRGSDHAKGTELLRAGTRISPMDVAVVASAGLAGVEVSRRPRIAVVSTGNELVPAGEPIAEHQVRLSNGPAVVAMLAEHGYPEARHVHLPDDAHILETSLGELIASCDVLILSGGVSMGKADFVPDVLRNLKVERVFHRISQRPGKPMWFGTGPAGQAVFALPGNPVSTLVCCRHYVVAALRRMAGMPDASPCFAVLARPVSFAPELTYFLPVRVVSSAAGQVLALPVPTNTSGDFASLAGTDGYVELAREQSEFPAGTVAPLYRWR
ncbi:MAG TPA: molybdopterin molybdotransferase MoeA [Woeseiaceae bacterium]|nr:molybdopterin molybdotransferase MoeA [Woeseiaceae bacterium]